MGWGDKGVGHAAVEMRWTSLHGALPLYYDSFCVTKAVGRDLGYQSLEGCHFIWKTEMGRSPGWTARLGNTPYNTAVSHCSKSFHR